MTDEPTLAELQQLFHRLLRAPEGVRAGLEALVESGELEHPDLSHVIEGDEKLDANARLDLYASMYFYRLRDVLADEYDRVARCIGEVHFHNLITDYLLEHPPSAPSLREAGAALPGFIETHALAAPHPALADLAHLERARFEVFDARDQEVLDRESFMARSAEDPEGFTLRLAEATRRLKLHPRALALFREPEADAPEAADEPVDVFVYRTGHRVFHRPCVEDEARCLEAMAERPLTLSDLAECLLKHDASADEISERFAALLELWAAAEVLVFPGSDAAA